MGFPTDHEIFVFLLGAIVGSIITHFITTREKRIIYCVRKRIDYLHSFHDLHLVSIDDKFHSSRKASDEQILALYREAERDCRSTMRSKRYKKLDPTTIAAEVFICQELLDVPISVGIQALLKYGDNPDEFLEYWKQYRREKRRKAEEPNNSQTTV